MASLRMKDSKQDVKSKIQATDDEWKLLDVLLCYNLAAMIQKLTDLWNRLKLDIFTIQTLISSNQT